MRQFEKMPLFKNLNKAFQQEESGIVCLYNFTYGIWYSLN